MKVIKPPHPIPDNGFLVFLSGSIEEGSATHWQKEVEDSLRESNATILNPRRDNWDSSWKQEITNEKFHEQVSWELSGLEKSDLILMYFDPTTKSTVSLIELGLFGRDGKMIVCCPEGYFRKGNVDIVCQRYGIKQVDTLDELIAEVKRILYPSIEKENFE